MRSISSEHYATCCLPSAALTSCDTIRMPNEGDEYHSLNSLYSAECGNFMIALLLSLICTAFATASINVKRSLELHVARVFPIASRDCPRRLPPLEVELEALV